MGGGLQECDVSDLLVRGHSLAEIPLASFQRFENCNGIVSLLVIYNSRILSLASAE
jgi:hypothetical protein